jgi:hypothetical protein
MARVVLSLATWRLRMMPYLSLILMFSALLLAGGVALIADAGRRLLRGERK